MRVLPATYFNRAYWAVVIVLFVLICLRAFFIPLSHDEAATFFFYVQSADYLPYRAHVYTNNHVLNSALTNFCYHVAGAHRFVLRIPNILSFLLLCFAIYRLFPFLKNTTSKILLAGLFLFTFNFLDFFELSRGYGISMACLLMGMSFLAHYFEDQKFKNALLFSLFLQLAVAANLILVVVAVILLFYVFVFQFLKGFFLQLKNVCLQIVNLFILGFWIKFSFFLKEKGALDYGVGDSYWDVSFKTLFKLLYGSDSLWLQLLIIILFAVTVIGASMSYKRYGNSFRNLFHLPVFFLLCLLTFILAFYLQKKTLGVNYPEDRTGLFFFLFFVLSIAFVSDQFKLLSRAFAILLVLPTFLLFILSLNLTHFGTPFYHTMPRSLYQQLEKEYEKQKTLFTVGGHRVRELNYAFLNYKGMLNPMDDSEEMQMCFDYYYAMKMEAPFYKDYYDEIGYDKDWDHVLLKRKEPVRHKEFYSLPAYSIKGNSEFYEVKRISDSTFKIPNPVELYAELEFYKAPKPFNAFFVLQVNDSTGKTVCYKRIVLNWLDNDLSAKTRHIKLTTGTLPPNATIVVYLWNIDKQDVDMTIRNLQLYQLYGKGVNVKIPAQFYSFMYNLNKKMLL